MAVDTQEKRASAISAGKPWQHKGIFPDGSIDEPERAFACHAYTGIDIDEGGSIVYPPTVSAQEVAFARGLTGDYAAGICAGFMGREG